MVNIKNAAEISGLTKKYKSFTLGGIDLDIPCGFSAVLIGTNGAGKTTLIDIISGVTSFDGGSISYFGGAYGADSDYVKNAIGYCASSNMLPSEWDVKNIAEIMPLAFDNFSADRFTALCERFGLDRPSDRKRKKLSKMSDGNKMRTYLAAVFARDTKMLVLDEPASFLDPLARDMLCDMFREYLAERDGERTILFSTHNIADMENAADYAVFMSEGKITESGFIEDLKEKYRTVHGDARISGQARPLMLSFTENDTAFEGLCPAENAEKLACLDAAVEIPTLYQMSVGILKQAGKD